VLEDRIALHALKCVGRKRKLLRVGGGVDPGYRQQIDVHVNLDHAAGAADVEIPAPQGKALRFGWIHDERRTTRSRQRFEARLR